MGIFSLKAKLITILLISVALFGSINLALFHTMLLKGMAEMLTREGKILTSLFAEEILPFVLSGDAAGSAQLSKQLIKENPDVIYVVVLDGNGNLFSSISNRGFPEFIMNGKINDDSVSMLKSGSLYFQDIGRPMLGGIWGSIHLGISEHRLRKDVNRDDIVLFTMIIIFLLTGSIGSILISSHISSGVKEIVNAMDIFGIEGGIPYLPTKRRDEIGIIARNLEDTLLRLQGLYRENQSLLMKMRELDKLTMVGLLASGLSHEINNPITALSTSLERISRDPSNVEQVSNYLSPMKEAVSHIRDVLNNLLSFVRRKKNLECKADIKDTIKKVETLMGSHLKASRVLLNVEVPDTLPFITFDPVQMVQVLMNIIFNSIQAMPFGGLIKLRVEDIQDNIQITVEDKGEGMDEDTFKKAFDPLFTTRSKEGGTGLGLAICKTLVEEHGGIIEIQSNKGEGTVVKCTLKKVECN